MPPIRPIVFIMPLSRFLVTKPRRMHDRYASEGVRQTIMLTDNFLRGRRRRELSDDEKEAIEGVLTAPVTLPRRKVVTSRGDVVTRSTFLISGFMCRYMDGSDGHRQLVSIPTPGDFVDLLGYPLQRLDHDIATSSECTVAHEPHDKLTQLIERLPHLGRVL